MPLPVAVNDQSEATLLSHLLVSTPNVYHGNGWIEENARTCSNNGKSDHHHPMTPFSAPPQLDCEIGFYAAIFCGCCHPPSRPIPSAGITIHVRARPASSASAGPSYIALWLRVLSEKRLKIIMHAMVRICKPFKKLIFFIFPFRRIENVCLLLWFQFFSIIFSGCLILLLAGAVAGILYPVHSLEDGKKFIHWHDSILLTNNVVFFHFFFYRGEFESFLFFAATATHEMKDATATATQQRTAMCNGTTLMCFHSLSIHMLIDIYFYFSFIYSFSYS